jgi:hypothetical protein
MSRPLKNKLKPLKLSKKEKAELEEQKRLEQEQQILDADVQVIECEHFNDIFLSMGTDLCLMNSNLTNMLIEIKRIYNRIPEVVYHYKNNYYTSKSEEEDQVRKNNIIYNV